MSHLRIIGITGALLLGAVAHADDRGYVLGIGASADNNDGVSASVFGDYSFNQSLSVSADYASVSADAVPDSITTRDWSVGARYDFGPLGIAARGGQSGDPKDFDADDVQLEVFHSGERWQWSARYLRRDIDLRFRTTLNEQPVEFSIPLTADGYRASIAYRTASKWRWQLTHRRYDYDRDLSPLSGRFITRRLSPTTLTLSSALLDDSTEVSVEMPLPGSRALSLQMGRDTLAGNLGEVDSISIGFLMPAGIRGDLELALGTSDSSGLASDSSVYFSVLYLYYGGFD
ncbi:MAG: hypothetical protein AAF004_10670 [Pseudomonadota bacterium]